MTLEAWLKEVERTADGVYVDDYREPAVDEAGSWSNAEVLEAFEYGNDFQPPRPFLEGMADKTLVLNDKIFGGPEETPYAELIREKLNKHLEEVKEEIYQTQGASIGASFEPLAESTIKMKAELGIAPDPSKALVETRQMLNSLIIR